MTNFIAPGALSHFRLGNEPNTYAEFEIGYNHKLDKDSKKSVDLVLMLSGYSELGKQESFNLKHVSQLYAKMNNAIGNADIWIGKRYYYRKDYHIIDYFWYNPGQEATVGVGIENIRGKKYKDDISFALFSFENKNVKSLKDYNMSSKTGVLQSYTLDVRWSNIPTNKNGKITLWGRVSKRNSNNALGFGASKGYGFGVWHDQTNLFNGKGANNIQFSYKKGNAISQSQYVGLPVYETYGRESSYSYDLNKAYAIELSDQFTYEKEKEFAINALALYRIENKGIIPYDILTQEELGSGQQIHWFTIGTRVLKYFHRHFNIALEIGSDYIDNWTTNKQGWLTKITIAPQFSWDYGFSSRPVIRPFLTYAVWSDNLVGQIGKIPENAPFGDRNQGFTYGVSFETWW